VSIQRPGTIVRLSDMTLEFRFTVTLVNIP
jgi:hypothetical protein